MKRRDQVALYHIRATNPAGLIVWDLIRPTTFAGVLVFIVATRRSAFPLRFTVKRIGKARQRV